MNVSEKLQDIAASSVTAQLETNEHGVARYVCVSLPHVKPFDAAREEGWEEPGELFIRTLDVPEQLRRNGIGTRLISALAHTAKENRVDVLLSVVNSPHVLRSFKRLFGDNNVELYETDSTSPYDWNTPLPITLEQAAQSLDREVLRQSAEDDGYGFRFKVRLGNIALSSLEQPVTETNREG